MAASEKTLFEALRLARHHEFVAICSEIGMTSVDSVAREAASVAVLCEEPPYSSVHEIYYGVKRILRGNQEGETHE